MGRKTANSNELNNIYVLDSFYAKIIAVPLKSKIVL